MLRPLRTMREDIDAARLRDVALSSRLDALLNAPGLHAIWMHRGHHILWRRGGALGRFCARLSATITRSITGIEIHPGAQLGRRMYIDHGMGVVIGQTAVIGDDVLMYHGSTVGGVDLEPGQRHATIGNGVMIGSGAKVLGRVHVGDGARIGANAVIVHDVPAGATAVGTHAQIRMPKQ